MAKAIIGIHYKRGSTVQPHRNIILAEISIRYTIPANNHEVLSLTFLALTSPLELRAMYRLLLATFRREMTPSVRLFLGSSTTNRASWLPNEPPPTTYMHV